MKRILFIAALAVLSLTACQQDLVIDDEQPAGGIVFTATTDGPSTKTAMSANGSGYDVVWQSGDEITIVDGDNNVGTYSTTSTTNRGDFSFVSGSEAVTPNYKAYFPADLYNGGKPTLPATQTYVDNNIAGFPMYAESNDTSLGFKNLCGIIRLNISTTQTGMKVSKITLTADQGMSGAISNAVELADDGYVAEVTGTAGVTLDCGTEGVEISTTARPFLIAVPGNTYSGLAIKVVTTDGLEQTKTLKAGNTIPVKRSIITDITLSTNDIQMVVDLSSSNDDVTVPSGMNAMLLGSNQSRNVIIEGGGSVISLKNAKMRKLDINGDATIDITGTNTIYDPDYQNPIDIKEGSTVTFRGEGTFNLNGYYCEAAIACENNNADIVIESGTYNLYAGVGTARTVSVGGLTISGGIVDASGSQVGIYARKDVLISGGKVTSTGNSQGIYVYGGDLQITGGTVTAEQTQNSTFWGGPEALVAGIVVNTVDGQGVEGGNLTISGGTVNAIGHIGPGIGSSWHRSGWSYPSWTKSIVISGGTVTASTEQSGFGAIFYSGAFATTRCEEITITEDITKLTLIQGATAEKMFGSGDVSATFTVDGKDMTGYLLDPSSADWTFTHLQRTISTTTNDNDTWTFTRKP